MSVDHSRLKIILALAYRYHDGQFREHKDGAARRVPYITHPVGVAKICAELWPHVDLEDKLDVVLEVALAHDLLEDTAITLGELELATSSRAAELVQILTKPVSTGFSDRSARNRSFLSSIAAAGATAKYVKVCDALHNLSRPDSMPTSLLEKTIRKAKRDYLPLTIDPHFSNEVRCRLEQSIEMAEECLSDSEDFCPPHQTLEDFLRYCVNRSSGKVLEIHDIVDIFLELPGMHMVHQGTILDFEQEILVDWLSDQTQNPSGRFTARLLEKGELVLSGKGFARESVQKLTFQKLILLPVEGPARDLMNRHFFVLGCDNAKCRPWATVSSLRAAVAILTERLRERDARELADYSEWVSKAQLKIDPRSAARLQMTYDQMEKLARLADAAAIEIGAILAGVELIGRELESFGGVVLTEHRLKSAESAATKLVRRCDGNWHLLDDIIGIRVVLLNDKAVAAFTEAFQAKCSDPSSIWNVDMGVLADSREVVQIRSSSGYRATHLRFHVKNALKGVGDVGCEIQVRTVFQDAWARLAHETSYKSSSSASKPLLRNLKLLSKMCEEADLIANKLLD